MFIAKAVGRPVEIQAYADRIVIRQDGIVVAEHARAFGRDKTIYDPWHYVPALARKPGALRNGAPFKDWVLPGALERVRRKLAGSTDGDRQMVKILVVVLTAKTPTVRLVFARDILTAEALAVAAFMEDAAVGAVAVGEAAALAGA